MTIIPQPQQVLTGLVQGITRQHLIEQAQQEAATYYGTPCIEIILYNEQAETARNEHDSFSHIPSNAITPTQTIYTANYQSGTYHQNTNKPCPKCGKETK